MNKLILIDGGPASGKNTLGEILVEKINAQGDKSVLIDKDKYVQEFCPKWIWENDQQKEKDLLSARINFKNDINEYLKNNFTVVAIGARFISKKDVIYYTSEVAVKNQVYLYHLSVPFELRNQRLNQRGPHSLIDLEGDQKDRDAIKSWPGYVYNNIHSPEIDAENLFELIQNKIGMIR